MKWLRQLYADQRRVAEPHCDIKIDEIIQNIPKKMAKKRKLNCLKNNSEQSSYFKLSSRFDFCLIFAGFFCEPPAWFPRLHNPITKCLRIWMASAPLRDWYGRNHRENQDISGGKQHDRINSQPQFKVLIPKFSLKPLDRQHFNKLGYDRHQSGWRHSKQGRVMRKSSARGGGWAAILTEFNIFPFFSSFSSFFLFSLFPSPPHTQFFYTFSSSHFPFFIIFSLPLLSFFSTLAFFTSFFPRARVCVCECVCVWVCVSLSPPPCFLGIGFILGMAFLPSSHRPVLARFRCHFEFHWQFLRRHFVPFFSLCLRVCVRVCFPAVRAQ